MSNPFFDHPILNSPYECPQRHWELDPDAEVREPPARVYHRPQPVLDLAAGTAHVKPAGDAYLWDRRKSPNDVAPLCAVTWALNALLTQPEVYRSAYEDAGLVVA